MTVLSNRRVFAAAVMAALVFAGGCQDPSDWFKTDASRFLSPDKVVDDRVGSPINPILQSMGPTDRTQEVLPNATFPREGDWSYTDVDYVIGPTDIVDISVMDLFQEGLETVLRRQVSDSGFIDLPLLPERIKAEDLTKDELKQAIINHYSPDILRSPMVSVTVAAQRQNTFSVIGAVARPGTYSILRKDMRLLEAMALAGGVSQYNINYIYIIRPKPARRIISTPSDRKPVTSDALPAEPKEVPGGTAATATSTAPVTDTATEAEKRLRELEEALKGLTPGTSTSPAPETAPAPSSVRFVETDPVGPAAGPAEPVAAGGEPRWIYSGGKWVKVQSPAQSADGAKTQPTQPGEAADPFGWSKVDRSDQARVIAINLEQLRNGEPRMNIVMRNNDIVHVPSLDVGEFYIMGEVGRPGVYSLTGRQITVKMAVAAAGNFNGLAWPENTLLIRRIGGTQEQIIPINLEAIFRGEDPDLFLKPDDVIAVGTDPRASFFAVIRNAFRMTYGFGFIYDRNFADPQFTTPTSRRFTRW